MTTTNQHNSEIILINIFNVEPEKQQSAAKKITDIYKDFVSKQPGFISARVQKSLDGTRVAATAQWASQEALTGMQRNPAFHDFVKILEGDIVSNEGHTYEIVYTVEI